MKRYYSIIVLCGLICVVCTGSGCKKPPPPPEPVFSDTGDLEAKEITFSPNPAKVNENTSINFKVANIGATNVKADFRYKVIGPELEYYYSKHRNVQMLKGAIVTETDTGWHPSKTGGFTIECSASLLGNDTNPSNNSMSILGSAELPLPSSPSPTVIIPPGLHHPPGWNSNPSGWNTNPMTGPQGQWMRR